MTSTYNKIFSQLQLSKAFNRMYGATKPASRGSSGIDGISLNDFRARQESFVSSLHKSLLNKEYEHQYLKPFLIPKKDKNKDRLICVPSVCDRVVQRATLNFLSHRYHSILANDISYGFIFERSVEKAARHAVQLRTSHPWVFQTDITSFFDKVPRDILQEKVRSSIRERSLHSILSQVINCEISPTSASNQDRIAKIGIKAGVGVRQGMPLSPFFANLFLNDFDRKIIGKKWKAVRYADDLIFFAKSRQQCIDIAEQCEEMLSDLRLSIPKIGPGEKSKIYTPTESAEFLGLCLSKAGTGYELRLSDEQRHRILKDFQNMGSVKELITRRINIGNFKIILQAKREGYLGAYECCTNLQQLADDLDKAVMNVLIKIYTNDLKIPLANIGPEARKFLLV